MSTTLLWVLSIREKFIFVVVPLWIKPPATWGHSTIQTQISDKLQKMFKGLLPKREGRWSTASLLNNDKGLLLGTACTYPYPKENRVNSAFFFQVAIRLTISCYDANARNSRHWLTTPVSYRKFSHIEFVWLPKRIVLIIKWANS